MKKRISIVFITLALTALAVFSNTPNALAGGQVTDCSDDTEFTNMVAGGGLVTFDCGTATIALDNPGITIGSGTTIDGGEVITLSGAGGTRLFLINNGAQLTLQNISLERGYFNGEGGAILNNGYLVLDHVTVQNSYAPDGGGGIATTGPTDVSDSTFSDNISSYGAAIYGHSATAVMTINDSIFHDNKVSNSNSNLARGGAIYLIDGASATIRGSDLFNNKAQYGGAIAVLGPDSAVSLENSKVRNNQADQGGGLFNDGTANLTTTTVSGNKAALSGGILNYRTLDLNTVTISNNEATISGGGLENVIGTSTLTRVTISGNSAINSGGGIYNSQGGTLNVGESTLNKNSVGNFGGGIHNAGSTVNLTNVTLSGNTAGQGGGISNYSGTSSLLNVTLNKNKANANGGNLYDENNTAGKTITLKNTIVANSVAGGNCYEATSSVTPITSAGYNLSNDNTCAPYLNQAGDKNGTRFDPLLGALANNSGATKTHLPQLTSPVIDHGTYTGAPTNDQRGVLRPQGTKFDIGAVEVECNVAPPKPALLKPKNGKGTQDTTPKLDWGDVNCAETYNVVVREGTSSGTVVFSATQLQPSKKVITTALDKGKTYFWQVTAVNKTDKTKSDWWSFKVN